MTYGLYPIINTPNKKLTKDTISVDNTIAFFLAMKNEANNPPIIIKVYTNPVSLTLIIITILRAKTNLIKLSERLNKRYAREAKETISDDNCPSTQKLKD